MRYYYEDNELLFKIEGKIHEKIVLNYNRYKEHINHKHREVHLYKIFDILNDPDYVYKQSHATTTYYYEKEYNGSLFRVVIVAYKKHIKKVATAYRVEDAEAATVKHNRCVYDKKYEEECQRKEEELLEDTDFFYNLFNNRKDDELRQEENYDC